MRYIKTRNFDHEKGTCEVQFSRSRPVPHPTHKTKWFVVKRDSLDSKRVATVLCKYKPAHVGRKIFKGLHSKLPKERRETVYHFRDQLELAV